MRLLVALVASVILFSCDDERLYEKNVSFNNRIWRQADKAEFEFTIDDNAAPYNLYLNVRNSVDYPYSRIFINYKLQDSLGMVLEKQLLNSTLFDVKTGKPYGTSGLGDIYDHQILVKKNHLFPNKGNYKISFEQFMRKDTLDGVLAVGLRVEKTLKSE
jgi:gliding motility-associated lipoprotein GldH